MQKHIFTFISIQRDLLMGGLDWPWRESNVDSIDGQLCRTRLGLGRRIQSNQGIPAGSLELKSEAAEGHCELEL